MVNAQTSHLWARLRQAQLLTQAMAAPCGTLTQDAPALQALGDLDMLSQLLGELLAQALAQLEALETPA